jgi:hypothetical protein
MYVCAYVTTVQQQPFATPGSVMTSSTPQGGQARARSTEGGGFLFAARAEYSPLRRGSLTTVVVVGVAARGVCRCATQQRGEYNCDNFTSAHQQQQKQPIGEKTRPAAIPCGRQEELGAEGKTRGAN